MSARCVMGPKKTCLARFRAKMMGSMVSAMSERRCSTILCSVGEEADIVGLGGFCFAGRVYWGGRAENQRRLMEDEELARRINDSIRAWVRVDPNRKVRPFHLIAVLLIDEEDEPRLGPSASKESVVKYDRIVRGDEGFRAIKEAEETIDEIHEDLLDQLVRPFDSSFPSLETIVCVTKRFSGDGTILNCCTEEEIERGCDQGAGTLYLAKTNGEFVVYSGRLRSVQGRTRPFRFVGYEAPSVMLFAILHEFGHVMYINPRTRKQFEGVSSYYNRLVSLIDPELRREAGIITGDADFNEFQANNFAILSLRNFNSQ